jgi:hypothetical protein
MVIVCSQKYINGHFKKMSLSHVACSQIWLNLPMDHHHFGYITKLTGKKKTLLAIVFGLGECKA